MTYSEVGDFQMPPSDFGGQSSADFVVRIGWEATPAETILAYFEQPAAAYYASASASHWKSLLLINEFLHASPSRTRPYSQLIQVLLACAAQQLGAAVLPRISPSGVTIGREAFELLGWTQRTEIGWQRSRDIRWHQFKEISWYQLNDEVDEAVDWDERQGEILKLLPASQPESSIRADEAEQLSLGLGGGFSPSKALIDIWIENLKAWASEARRSFDFAAASSDTEVQQEFTRTLILHLVTIAQQIRYGAAYDKNLTRGLTFTPLHEVQICDRFFIIPSHRGGEFLSLLRTELTNSVAGGAKIQGAWGRLALNESHDLFFDLTPREIVSNPEFTRARVIE